MPSRFEPLEGTYGATTPGDLHVEPRGDSLLISSPQVRALVSAPVANRGGGVVEGVTHRVSGGDLVTPPASRSEARAWEVCLGKRTTDPDLCGPDGVWVDSRSMPVRWRVAKTTDGSVLLFQWSDSVRGLSVDQEVSVSGDGLVLRLAARALGTALGIVAVRFPFLEFDYRPRDGSKGELVIPRGNLGLRCSECRVFGAIYPGMYQTMPWFGVLKGNAGLYVGAHDPTGSMKRVVAVGPRGDGKSYFEIYPEDSGAVGNVVAPDWSFDVAPVCAERGWPALAHRYKEWVTSSTDWGHAPLLRDRADIPADLRDGAWWFVHSIVPEAGIDLLEAGTNRFRRDFPDLPTVHHWYEWHRPGMDRGFPDHFPKPGVKEAIARLEADGRTRILLFTNATHTDQSTAPPESGRPPCAKGASQYPRYWNETARRADGKRIFVVPSSQACLAAMDLTSEIWRTQVLMNSDAVTGRLGAAGVYLDVIGNVNEGSWSSPRNPPGRGAWVPRAARELVRDVSRNGRMVVVEGALEQMTGIATAGVNYIDASSEMIPIYPLVWHERFILAGMPSLVPDDQDALRMKNALAIAWGLQPGLANLQWYEPHAMKAVRWARDLLTVRRHWANWLAYGEYMGPLELAPGGVAQKVAAGRWAAFMDDRPPRAVERTAIEASLYRGIDGQAAIIFVNMSERRAEARFVLPPPFDRSRILLVSASKPERPVRTMTPVGGVLEIELDTGDVARAELGVGVAPTKEDVSARFGSAAVQ